MNNKQQISDDAAIIRLPLPTLLSQVLVAFTIEFDNEFAHRVPHRTTVARTASASRSGPWLTSMVMYSNLMRVVPEAGVTVRELRRLARVPKPSLAGMERWGYISVGPDPADQRPKPSQADWLVRPTAKGRMAQEVWRPLFGAIEERWQECFGKDKIGKLRESLMALAVQFGDGLPEYLPVLGYGLWTEVLPDAMTESPVRSDSASRLHLPALLSKVLLAFTLEFERESAVSLAICANVLRVLGVEAVRMRDLPHLSGVSKEAVSMTAGYLEARGYALVEPERVASRGKVVRLTPRGGEVRGKYGQLLDAIEARWRERYGNDAIRGLREALERLADGQGGERSPLFQGLTPYPDGWRARVPEPATLPHYPMVLHRGGYPDGS